MATSVRHLLLLSQPDLPAAYDTKSEASGNIGCNAAWCEGSFRGASPKDGGFGQRSFDNAGNGVVTKGINESYIANI